MALNDADREWVKLIGEKLTYQVIKEALPGYIKAHLMACPTGIFVNRAKWILAGVIFGVVLNGAGLLVIASKLLM